MLPGLVENLDVFQLHADAGPELHGVRGVVFATSLYGAICMSSNGKHQENKNGKLKQESNHYRIKHGPKVMSYWTGLGIIDHIPEKQPLAKITRKG